MKVLVLAKHQARAISLGRKMRLLETKSFEVPLYGAD